jgi:sugar phosphate isomerase/epimerase
MKLGIIESVLPPADEATTFRLARQLGFEGIELPISRHDLRDPARARLQRLQAAANATGLEIPSLLMGDHNRLGSIASTDAAIVEAAREDVRQGIEWAAALGAAVILVPFFANGDIVTEEEFQQAVASFQELSPIAHAHGVILAFEGYLSAGEILRMAAAVNSPAFGCYFDLANVVSRGRDAATEIRELNGLIVQVHMKESRPGALPAHPGLGWVDYSRCAIALQEIDYDGWMVLETPRSRPELVARDVSFTRRSFPALPKPAWPQVGAFSYGFTAWDDLIEKFTGAGLTAVQIGSDLLNDALDHPDQIPARRAQLEENGITVAGLAGYRNLTAPDPQKRRANIDYIKRCLEYATRFGTSVVATETGSLNPQSEWKASPLNWSKEAWDSLHAALDELLPVAEAHGSILALEGYVNNVLQTQGQLQALLERYPTPHLQVVLDPFNYLNRHLLPVKDEVIDGFLYRFEHRFVLAHLKDVSAEGAEIDTPEFGAGVFPHKRYFDFLRTHRPDLPIILEHLPFDHIPAAIQRIREIALG